MSFLLHAGLAALIFLPLQEMDSTRWSGGNDLAIEMAPVFVSLRESFKTTPDVNQHPLQKSSPVQKKIQHRTAKFKTAGNNYPAGLTFNKSGLGNSDTPHHGSGAGLDKSGAISAQAPNVLARIRQEIMRKQFYPGEARAQKLSGTVKVNFRILENGGLDYVRVLKGSGHSILDEAALTTIKKATPLPYYPESIALSLDYQIK